MFFSFWVLLVFLLVPSGVLLWCCATGSGRGNSRKNEVALALALALETPNTPPRAGSFASLTHREGCHGRAAKNRGVWVFASLKGP